MITKYNNISNRCMKKELIKLIDIYGRQPGKGQRIFQKL